MRRLSSIVALFLLFVMMVPVLACAATPANTRMEQDCCQQMHGRCGEMAKQGCCQMEVRNDPKELPVHVVVSPTLPLTAMPVLYVPRVVLAATAGYRWRIPNQHAPPGLLLASTTVLRI